MSGRDALPSAAAPRVSPAPPPRRGLTARPWWPTARRLLTIAFFAAVLGLVAHQAKSVDWPAVLKAIRAYPPATLLLAAGFALASHAVYATYDLIGRHQTRHGLAAVPTMAICSVSYVFNLNFGSLVGAIASRFRLYTRRGLATEVVTQVLLLSMLTNWLGYLVVGGAVALLRPIDLPPGWTIGSTGLRVAGAAMLAAAVGYALLCLRSRRRTWQVRGAAVTLPSGRIAALQFGLSATNWLLMSGVVYTLLQHRVDYPTVLSVLLLAAVAGVITHVPAGLGVLEAVFVALLGHRAPAGDLLAALIVYRALYYLAPLLPASLAFVALERSVPARERSA